MIFEEHFVLIGLLIIMACSYILGRMRGYRKGMKKAKQCECSRIPELNLTCRDSEEIERIAKAIITWALGYHPDYDDEIDSSEDGLAQQFCKIGADWVNGTQNALQIVKCEIISEVIDRIVSETSKLQDHMTNHVTQEIRAQDKRTVNREAMRAARAKEKAETAVDTEETAEAVEI